MKTTTIVSDPTLKTPSLIPDTNSDHVKELTTVYDDTFPFIDDFISYTLQLIEKFQTFVEPEEIIDGMNEETGTLIYHFNLRKESKMMISAYCRKYGLHTIEKNFNIYKKIEIDIENKKITFGGNKNV